MALIEVENLTFKYPNCTENAIENISFSAEKGDFIAVCGATGSGKSTLLRLLKRELAPNGECSGVIKYNGTPLSELDDETSVCKIGFVM